MKRRDSYIEITEDILSELQAHRQRTGMSATNIFRYVQQYNELSSNARLTANMVTTWINGKTKSAHGEHLTLVLEAYRGLPDAESAGAVGTDRQGAHPNKIAATDEFLAALVQRLEKSKYASNALFLHADCPKDFTRLHLSRIRKGEQRLIKSRHYQFLSGFLGVIK